MSCSDRSVVSYRIPGTSTGFPMKAFLLDAVKAHVLCTDVNKNIVVTIVKKVETNMIVLPLLSLVL